MYLLQLFLELKYNACNIKQTSSKKMPCSHFK